MKKKPTLTEGTKHDTGKLRYDLIPPEAYAALAHVYTLGAAKYEDRNWEKGIKYSRILGAMERHLQALKSGEMVDGEDGQHHAASVAWCAFSLMTYEFRGLEGFDDMPPAAFYPYEVEGVLKGES